MKFLYSNLLTFLLAALGGFVAYFLIVTTFISHIENIFHIDDYRVAYSLFLIIYFSLPIASIVFLFDSKVREALKFNKTKDSKVNLIVISLFTLIGISFTLILLNIFFIWKGIEISITAKLLFWTAVTLLVFTLVLFFFSLLPYGKESWKLCKEFIIQYSAVFLGLFVLALIFNKVWYEKETINNGINPKLEEAGNIRKLKKIIKKQKRNIEQILTENAITIEDFNINNSNIRGATNFPTTEDILTNLNLIDTLYEAFKEDSVSLSSISVKDKILSFNGNAPIELKPVQYEFQPTKKDYSQKDYNRLSAVTRKLNNSQNKLEFIQFELSSLEEKPIENQYTYFRIFFVNLFLVVILCILIIFFHLERKYLIEKMANTELEEYPAISHIRSYLQLFVFLIIPLFVPYTPELFDADNPFIPVSPIKATISQIKNIPPISESKGKTIQIVDNRTTGDHQETGSEMTAEEFYAKVKDIAERDGMFISTKTIERIDTNSSLSRRDIELFFSNIKPYGRMIGDSEGVYRLGITSNFDTLYLKRKNN